MAFYYGVVKDGVIVLAEDIQLPEGLAVEIHIATPEILQNGPLTKEEIFRQGLIAQGLLLAPRPIEPSRPPRVAPEDYTPIVVEGEPLSEQIIRERR